MAFAVVRDKAVTVPAFHYPTYLIVLYAKIKSILAESGNKMGGNVNLSVKVDLHILGTNAGFSGNPRIQ